jgi:hypothetical protein
VLLRPGRIDYGDMGSIGMSDMPTTTVALNIGGRHVTRAAYGLTAKPGGGRLTPAQAAARRALLRFVEGLPRAPAERLYTPSSLAVYAAPFSGGPQPGGVPLVWPLRSNLATAGIRLQGTFDRCIAVTGSETPVLLRALQRATSRTRWLARPSGGLAFQLVVRPLLPGDQACHT